MDVWLDCDLKNKANIMTDPICLHHLAKKKMLAHGTPIKNLLCVSI